MWGWWFITEYVFPFDPKRAVYGDGRDRQLRIPDVSPESDKG